MANETARDRRDKNEQQPRRDPRSSKPQPAQILPPLMVDGLESVRDPNC
jgi:hypothetical protein